ncbi:hypothetical protein HMPREF9078_00962, partial [Capnocytophaga sp. oral taxon 380 str. F0488]
ANPTHLTPFFQQNFSQLSSELFRFLPNPSTLPPFANFLIFSFSNLLIFPQKPQPTSPHFIRRSLDFV